MKPIDIALVLLAWIMVMFAPFFNVIVSMIIGAISGIIMGVELFIMIPYHEGKNNE